MTATDSPSFSPDLFAFLRELKQHNDREWFGANKARYEREVKEPALAFIEDFGYRLPAVAPQLVADKRSMFRIYRDTRFAKDKSPYKTNVYARFPWVGRGSDHDSSDDGGHGASGYFNVMPGESYVGGGMWAPEKPRLDAFRAAVLDEPERVRAALEDPVFIAEFGPVHSHDSLKRVPPGFPPDHPMAELFRYKSVTFGHQLSDDDIRSPELPDILADSYAAAVPVLRFLSTLG